MYASRELKVAKTLYGARGGSAASAGKRSHRWPMLVREHASDRPEDAQQLVDPEDEQSEDPEDELFLLGERCARAYMHADALHYQAMKLLAEFDRRSGWRDTGFSSTAEWLAWRIGIKPNAARERLRTALALEQLPQISEAMRNGEISFTKVRALTRVATPESEPTLLDFARAGSAANLERMVRGWKALDRKSEVTAEQIRHRSRRFSAFVDDDGMVVVRGRLDPEVGALFMRAVEAASDALYKGEHRREEDQREEDQVDESGKEGGGQKDDTRVTAVTSRYRESGEPPARQDRPRTAAGRCRGSHRRAGICGRVRQWSWW